MPSVGAGSRKFCFANMTHRSCAALSRSEKYQCPLRHALKPAISPRTHSGGRPASMTARARFVTSPTVHAPSAEAALKRSTDAPTDGPRALGRGRAEEIMAAVGRSASDEILQIVDR